jgi:DNA adenine methylase
MYSVGRRLNRFRGSRIASVSSEWGGGKLTATEQPLKAPFPYAGGKSRVAALVWSRLGDVDNYVEPFAGSLATLLRRPAGHFRGGYRVETVNDLNHYIVNFWRAVKADPEQVAAFADWPVTEADMHARHKWLVRSVEAIAWRERMQTDPEAFDAKIAGWWVWGQCCWIGGAWCNDIRTDYRQIPHLNRGSSGGGVHQGTGESPTDWGQVRHLSHGGQGVTAGRPQLTDAFDIGRGVNAGGTLNTCATRRAWLTDWMRRLSDRLRLVRTLYGHWSRPCDSESTLARLGTTGVFLDPPYPAKSVCGKKSRDPNLYATDKGADLDKLRDEVLAWCRKWGSGPLIRIAVCGYEGDGYEALEGWTMESWEASGGYSNQRRAGKKKSANPKRERVWFSPACIPETPPADLFALVG